MPRPSEATVLLDLPAVAGRAALRAGLIAMRLAPTPLPTDRRGRDAVLRGLADKPCAMVFIDISNGRTTTTPSLLQLDASLPRDASRRRIVLTRLAGGPGLGHVSEADRRWIQRLGFADLIPEFDAMDCEGSLRQALDLVARELALEPLPAAELARYARVMNDARDTASARATIRALCGLSAEALATLLAQSLDITDRTWRLQRYPQCFVGSEAVAWLAHHFKRSTSEALALGQALASLGLLVHVAHEHPFLDDTLYYRLAISPAADALDLGDVQTALVASDGVPIADRSHLGKLYPHCWVGSEAIDLLVSRHRLQRHDAWLLLHRLMQFGLIEHVTHSRPVIDGNFYYRFTGQSVDGNEQ
ncbi:MAG: hypothetical protein A3E25_08150 [Burkholderiales bacterium RIFCSPHIGHO2_12_FULL_69_20]|nr:MAG: hypothetical protein A3E25_08150 [Burkholderiales bacterium RIFCSPHIGHO2_12_FULL_69_20]